MKDSDFLLWIFDRLVNYGENPQIDYMIRLKKIQEETAHKEEVVASLMGIEIQTSHFLPKGKLFCHPETIGK